MTEILLILFFLTLMFIGVPISFSLGIVAVAGLNTLSHIPNIVVFNKMLYGLNSFVLLAVPLFILAANLMNSGKISEMLIDFAVSLIGHIRGGLAHANILVSMLFAGVSGSSQADTAGVGKILIPAMEDQGYDTGTAVAVTAISSTLSSIIPPSIMMVVYAGVTNVSVAALFFTGLIPGVFLGLGMMSVVAIKGKRMDFPKSERVEFKEIKSLFLKSLPALFTPVIIIGGIITGLYTPTQAAGFASLYALIIGLFFYKTITLRMIPGILKETLKLSSLSLFALATANGLGELLGYYNIQDVVTGLFSGGSTSSVMFLVAVFFLFLFIGTFMDGVPAMILFVPVILPAALAVGVDPIHLGLIIIITLSLGLVTPPYGLCLLIAGSIGNLSVEDSFRAVMPYMLICGLILMTIIFIPQFYIGIPKLLNPALFL